MRGVPGKTLPALSVLAGVSYKKPLSARNRKKLDEFVEFTILNGRTVWVHETDTKVHAHTLAFVVTPQPLKVAHVRS